MRRLIAGAAAGLLVVCGVGQVFADGPGTILQTFHTPSPNSGYDGLGDRFGSPIVPLGNSMVLVGATQDAGVGKVYLFDATSGSLLHTFEDPTPNGYKAFGVGICTLGDSVLITAPNDNTGGAGAGAAYLFTHSGPTWNDWQLSPQTVYGTAGANLGNSVARWGSDFLVGAPGDHTGQPGGAAYLYNGSNLSLVQTFANPNATAGAWFGYSVAASDSVAAIGAPEYRSKTEVGVAYSYRYDGSTWSAPKTIANPSGTTGLFGDSVAVAGNKILIGAPYDASGGNQGGAAYIFDEATTNLIYKFNNQHQGVGNPPYGARFGSFVTPVGSDILVSAPWDDAVPDMGAVYLFDGTTFDPLLTLHNDLPVTDWPTGDFGNGVSAFGNNILVGDVYADDLGIPNSGAVYLIQGVPEPSTIVLLGIGAISLLSYAWRRRKRAA